MNTYAPHRDMLQTPRLVSTINQPECFIVAVRTCKREREPFFNSICHPWLLLRLRACSKKCWFRRRGWLVLSRRCRGLSGKRFGRFLEGQLGEFRCRFGRAGYRCLIPVRMFWKASSTLLASSAEVSINERLFSPAAHCQCWISP